MRNRRWVLLALVLMAASLSCTGENGKQSVSRESEEETLERVEEVVDALGRDLKQRLVAELQAGGPAAAVQVCSEMAQDLAAARSTDGITFRRVSLKARNPADRPDEFEREALLELEELHRAGRLPPKMTKVLDSEQGRTLRYLRPIVIIPSCLVCHGPVDALDPEVAAMIAERYPEDEATGYAAGDLRGAFSVTVLLD